VPEHVIYFNLTSTIIVASYPVLKIKGARVNVFIHVYMPPEKVNNHQHTTTGVTILGGDYFATSDAHILPSLYKAFNNFSRGVGAWSSFTLEQGKNKDQTLTIARKIWCVKRLRAKYKSA